MKHFEIETGGEAEGQRLDRFLADWFSAEGETFSRAELQRWIRDGFVKVDGRAAKPRHSLSGKEAVTVDVPDEESAEILPEEIPVVILHEDEDIVVVDKPHGLVVHPGSGNAGGTLVNALLHACGTLCPLAGEDRPGIVHRLDKDTSGCLVAAKSERAYRSLVGQFSGRETGKEYIAVVDGMPTSESGRIENRIGRHPVHRQKMAVVPAPAGKEAITEYRLHRSDEEGRWSTLLCTIHTGRTHQIRVHCRENLRTPILGDPIYAQPQRQKVQVVRLMLHAWRLRFSHPADARAMEFEAPLPKEFLPFLPSVR